MSNNKKKSNGLHEELIKITNQELEESFKGSKIVLINHHDAVKFSEIFHDYMEPAIQEVIDNEKLLKRTLNWGQIIWNKAVAEKFPDHEKSKDFEILFPLFKATFYDQQVILKFLKRKKEKFSDQNFFIMEQTSLLHTKGRLSISVAALPMGE